tara:strand:- start:171 stop:734 length:564 start_codon:yes stop_codon:yes gene_type:complete
MSALSHQYSGSLHLIIGPMFSGKTTELLRIYNRYKIANKKCVLVKYKNDTRYDSNNKIITHNEDYQEAQFICNNLCDIFENKQLLEADIICIDEIQFYSDADIICDMWANNGKQVIVSGLNGDYKREPFEIISKLIPKAENITFLNAVCKETGKEAYFTKRKTESKDKLLIGGEETYDAVCRKKYFN